MRRPSFRQVCVALGVSLLLHSSLLGVWWWGVHADVGQRHPVTVLADAPGDDLTLTVALKEYTPPALPAVGSPTPPKNDTPRELAPSVRDVPPMPNNVVGTVGHQEPAPPMPPTGNNAGMGGGTGPRFGALHGRLKAGKSITYVLDRSSSMSANDGLGRAKGMLLASLRLLGDDVSFQIIAYNGGAQAFAARLLPATATNVAKAEAWLTELTPEGRSQHAIGLREGLSFGSDAVFILTDADDFTSAEVKAITSYVRQRVVIHAAIVGPRSDATHSPLEQFTQAHGGTVRYHGDR